MSVALEYCKRSRINNPGRSATGESMISRSVRSFGRIKVKINPRAQTFRFRRPGLQIL
jgi:predicted TIM-barrel fold metal-dependent hydrolase